MNLYRVVWLALLNVVLLAACSSSSGDGALESKITGQAQSVLDGTPQANRDFVVLDLSKTGEDQQIGSGSSDSSGGFEFKITGTATNIIVAFGATANEPRTSGLASFLEQRDVSKNLNNVTDIACQAGAQAVGDSSLVSTDLTAQRIANLELGAAQVLQSQSVDFNNADSVQAAVDQVRSLTNDGAQPPPSG